ncbi:Transmembrane E3 ubiquitin-protein ligase-like protein [Hapsidospora chrysogenum ATCC 11550]|uniref:DSC E3 ubiquitin ligase complex subunit A n=1 Tax=Hapsidospora chrysogenum (strain ATCC 11550 / CBS 779.69 / DSM 880 / IAM 14645 / JCM 23072 / IMI 49137) TaxID=857340 RepID=A0A086TE19_HAPC1|nr:Transmembrane E3 ubiquitin-protein ligase-like protein [Hapsidospora chrysogenum ATCC 11550]
MPPQQQQQQQSALGFVLFILMLWVIFPDSENAAQSLIVSDLAAERLKRCWSALDVLNQTRWGDFAPPVPRDDGDDNDYDDEDGDSGSWLNLTGFRREDGFEWNDLERFREKGLQLSRYAIPPVQGQQLWGTGARLPLWANASGTVHGEWVKTPGPVHRGYDSYNLSNSVPEMHWIGDKVDWARNITGGSGKMYVLLEGNSTVTEYEQLPDEHAPLAGGSIRNVKATLQIEDSKGSHLNWEMRLWGAHWPREGVILLTTTSEKFEGIFGLPHLTPSADYFQSSQMLLNQTLAHTIVTKQENRYMDQNAPWSSEIESPSYTTHPYPHCEFVMYAQVQPPSPQDLGITDPEPQGDAVANLIGAMESELQTPQGAPVGRIPGLQMSAVVYSPDCGFFLETKGPPDYPPGEARHLSGLKKEVHLHQVKTWLLVFALVVFLQVFLLKSQLAESYTPSTMARVSFTTASIMVIVDGMTFTAAATWVSSAASTFLPTLVLMFAAFLSMTIGGSFLAKIHEVQMPETRDRRDRNRQGNTGANDATTNTQPHAAELEQQGDTGSLLPAPVTAARPGPPSGPIIIPSDQDIDAEIADAAAAVPLQGGAQQRPAQTAAQTFQSIVGRYILLSLGISFLVISSTTWYPNVRSGFLNLCAFVYLSLWVPQIYRNTMRNCRRALRWQFVVGQSVLRILPLAYFWVKEDNFLYAIPERRAFLLICAWLWLQIVVLAAQDIVGPRFGVPARWTPEAWDYHPVLREDNLEAGGLPIGLVAEDQPGLRSSTDGDSHHHHHHERKRSAGGGHSTTRAIDCAICRELLEVPVVKAGEDATASVTGAFARRMYMVTPCRHIFHTACLEAWMRFRLQCPICREELPPL